MERLTIIIKKENIKKDRNKAQKEDDRIMEETQKLIIPPEKREQII